MKTTPTIKRVTGAGGRPEFQMVDELYMKTKRFGGLPKALRSATNRAVARGAASYLPGMEITAGR